MKADDERRLRAFETRCYRRLLGIRWFDNVTNEVVRKKAGREETVVDMVRKQKWTIRAHLLDER